MMCITKNSNWVSYSGEKGSDCGDNTVVRSNHWARQVITVVRRRRRRYNWYFSAPSGCLAMAVTVDTVDIMPQGHTWIPPFRNWSILLLTNIYAHLAVAEENKVALRCRTGIIPVRNTCSRFSVVQNYQDLRGLCEKRKCACNQYVYYFYE